MNISIVRPSLVYGPDVKGNLSMMMSWIDKGRFPPLPEIRNCRSMIHVDDLVRVLLLVAKDERANGEIFIATDGKRIDISSQNHGFAVDPDSLAGTALEVSHTNGNDGTVAGLQHASKPIFSVQYHPEGAPGPHDPEHLFQQFMRNLHACLG